LPNPTIITWPVEIIDMIRITESSDPPTFGLNWDHVQRCQGRRREIHLPPPPLTAR
jgi:hypothetical protein